MDNCRKELERLQQEKEKAVDAFLDRHTEEKYNET